VGEEEEEEEGEVEVRQCLGEGEEEEEEEVHQLKEMALLLLQERAVVVQSVSLLPLPPACPPNTPSCAHRRVR
jgi:hypothetical protein